MGGLQGREEARKVTSKRTLKTEIKHDKDSQPTGVPRHTRAGQRDTRRGWSVEGRERRGGGSQPPAQCLSAPGGCAQAPHRPEALVPGGDSAVLVTLLLQPSDGKCVLPVPRALLTTSTSSLREKNGLKISIVLGTGGAKARFWSREESRTRGKKQLHKKSTAEARRL